MPDRSVVVRLRAEVGAFKQAFGEATKAVDQTTAATQRAGKASQKAGEQATAGAKDQATASARLVKSAKDQEKAWTKAGVSLTAFGAISIAAFAGAVKAAIDWETAWTGVTKTVNATGPELDQLEGQLRDLTKVLPASHDEIASVAEAAGQMGVQTGSIAEFTKVMIQLGESTNLSADEASTALGQLMTVMGTAPQNIGRLGATLVALGNSGNSTEKDIVNMASRIAGAGKLVGASEGEVLALSSAMADLGIQSELGGGVASRVLLKIYSTVQSGGPKLDKFAAVAGLSADAFAKAFKDSPVQALNLFTKGLDGVESSGGNVVQVLSSLGFKSGEDVRVLLSLKGAGDKLTDSLKLQGVAWQQATALAAEADKRNATAAARMQIAMNQIQDDAITAGTAFLPVLAGIADSIASVADMFGKLPGPIQASLGGLAGVAGAASLAGGGFLLLAPRVLETVNGFRELRVANPDLARKLGKTTAVVGKLGAAFIAASAAVQIFGSKSKPESVVQYTKALQELNKTGQATGALKDVGEAFGFLKDPSLVEQAQKVGATVGRLFGADNYLDRYAAQFEQLGAAMANTFAVDPTLAAAEFNNVLALTGGTTDELLDLMPAYKDALDQAALSSDKTAMSSKAMSLGLAGVGDSADVASEALTKWREMVGEADAAFVDIGDAYQTVIDKNTEIATSTADATKSSKDSWKDYYDGVSVSFDDFLKQLEKQVKAQTDWESNIKALVGRVSDSTIDYLIQLGPKAAPLIAQMVKASDGELGKMEKLFKQHGKAAVDNFTASVEAARAPKVHVDADTNRARGGVAAFRSWAQAQAATITFTANIRKGTGWYDVANHGVKIKNAEGGAISGAGTGTSDSIVGLLSNGEHVWTAREVDAAGGQAAMYRMRHATLTGRMPAFASGGAVGSAERDVERARRVLAAAKSSKDKSDARDDLNDARARLQRVRDLQREIRVDRRRGSIRDDVTSGIGSAYSTIDRLLDESRNKDLSKGSRKNLADTAKAAEPALKRLYAQADKIEKALSKASDKLAELRQARDQTAGQLAGGFSFQTATDDARRYDDTPGGGIRERIDTKVVIGEAKAYAAKLRTFAARLETLRKLGMPASLLQEIVALGPDQGIPAADSWIAAGKGQIKAISDAYKDIDKFSNKSGNVIADAMYKGGIKAAKGVVDGLEDRQDDIEKQMLKIAKRIETALTNAIEGALKKAAKGKSSKSHASSFGLGYTTAGDASAAGLTKSTTGVGAASAAAGASYTTVYQLDSAAAARFTRGFMVEAETIRRRNETAMLRG
jgi:TP901 family phage tail tape measure protein